MDNDSKNLFEKIKIPEEYKDLQIVRLDFSVRLNNVLRRLDIKVLGDLQDTSFYEIEHARNCGRKTIEELRAFATTLQSENYDIKADEEYKINITSITQNEKISIPQLVKGISVDFLTFSTRTINILSKIFINTLSDFEAYSLNEIKQTGNCGWKTIDEIREFTIQLRSRVCPRLY